MVGNQGAGHQDAVRFHGDPAQPFEQAARPSACHRQAGQAEQDDEPARLGAREQELRAVAITATVKAIESGAPVVRQMAGVHHVGQEH
jgi:hypothetical protein